MANPEIDSDKMRDHPKFFFIVFLFLVQMNHAVAQLDVQGHRGCRGLMPENSIEGFIHALKIGVTTLEMDVVITADKQVLLSHEPYMSHEICLDSSGVEITSDNEKNHNIYQMEMAQIRQYDCGSKFHARFPDQEKFRTTKPLLSDVIDTVESYILSSGISAVDYNIEIKSTPETDGQFHPGPEEFADLLISLIEAKGLTSRTIIQSFDPRPLRFLKEKKSAVRLALLVENIKSPDWNIRRLGFKPDIYSPYYRLIGKRKVRKLQSEGIKVIPWTVNGADEMMKMIGMGVDGIITDYPDRLIPMLSR